MDFDLFSCTFETLSSLKFNQLQKLSTQFRVNKRWAKKREIIEKLLLLRDEEIKKKDSAMQSTGDESLSQDEWVDGSIAFPPVEPTANAETENEDRRLTFSISNRDLDPMDRRLTFNIVKNNENKKDMSTTNLDVLENFDRRLTYNADDLKKYQGLFKEYTVCGKTENGSLVEKEENKKDEKNISEVENVSDKAKKKNVINESETKEPGSGLNETDECIKLLSSDIKKLAMPSGKNLKLNRRITKEAKKSDFPNLKLSEKSIKIKKSCNGTADIKSPKHLRLPQRLIKIEEKSVTPKCVSSEKSGIIQRNASQRNSPDLSSTSTNKGQKDANRVVVPRRKSKTEDNVLVQSLKRTADIKYFSPRELSTRSSKRFSDSSRDLNLDLSTRSKIPRPKATVNSTKTITATKMPDFSKIHQRRFEQMDSLIDYKRKKEERAKKLFGIPQPGIPLKVEKTQTNTVFQFKSNDQKENMYNKSASADVNILQKATTGKDEKGRANRKDAIIRAGVKPNIVMTLKEQNRSHLNGVRTNKRFELQMKYRKM